MIVEDEDGLTPVDEVLEFDAAAVDHDERPLITMRCRAASLRELFMGRASSTTTRRGACASHPGWDDGRRCCKMQRGAPDMFHRGHPALQRVVALRTQMLPRRGCAR